MATTPKSLREDIVSSPHEASVRLPAVLIDINRIPDLAYLRESNGYLAIGALTRESDLDHSELIQTKYPILADTAAVIADPSSGTWRRSAAISPTAIRPTITRPPCSQWMRRWSSSARTAHAPSRSKIYSMDRSAPRSIPTKFSQRSDSDSPLHSGGAYLKIERKVGDFAAAAVAVQLTLGRGNICERIGIGLTNVGPTPIKAIRAEQLLRGQTINDQIIRQAAETASEEAQPSADQRGSVEYKRSLVRF